MAFTSGIHTPNLENRHGNGNNPVTLKIFVPSRKKPLFRHPDTTRMNDDDFFNELDPHRRKRKKSDGEWVEGAGYHDIPRPCVTPFVVCYRQFHKIYTFVLIGMNRILF